MTEYERKKVIEEAESISKMPVPIGHSMSWLGAAPKEKFDVEEILSNHKSLLALAKELMAEVRRLNIEADNHLACHADIKNLKKSLEEHKRLEDARQAKNGWLPIETAPYDGQVLLYGEEAGEISGPTGAQRFLGAGEYTDDTDWPGYNWELAGGDYYASWAKPTHWQPMLKGPDDAN